jgi:hypothetical protein
MRFQFSLLNIYHHYGCHLKGRAIMQRAACLDIEREVRAETYCDASRKKWAKSLVSQRSRVMWNPL